MTKMTELTPAWSQHQKSFYGKAHVLFEDGTYYLKSYATIVASFKDGTLRRTWGGWSATTARHVVAFCEFCGIPAVNKSQWDRMEVVDP